MRDGQRFGSDFAGEAADVSAWNLELAQQQFEELCDRFAKTARWRRYPRRQLCSGYDGFQISFGCVCDSPDSLRLIQDLFPPPRLLFGLRPS